MIFCSYRLPRNSSLYQGLKESLECVDCLNVMLNSYYEESEVERARVTAI